MFKKCLVLYLVVTMFLMGIAPRVHASFSPSETLVVSHEVRVGDLEKIRTVLENKLVVQRFQDLGFTVDQIASRLSEMSDEQIHSFAQKLDDVKVGGDGIGVVIAVLVIIVLVLVILQLTGKRVVVK
jgi:hypothetical protein